MLILTDIAQLSLLLMSGCDEKEMVILTSLVLLVFVEASSNESRSWDNNPCPKVFCNESKPLQVMEGYTCCKCNRGHFVSEPCKQNPNDEKFYRTTVCAECPFDPDDPNNQYYMPSGPHFNDECLKATVECNTGEIRFNGDRNRNAICQPVSVPSTPPTDTPSPTSPPVHSYPSPTSESTSFPTWAIVLGVIVAVIIVIAVILYCRRRRPPRNSPPRSRDFEMGERNRLTGNQDGSQDRGARTPSFLSFLFAFCNGHNSHLHHSVSQSSDNPGSQHSPNSTSGSDEDSDGNGSSTENDRDEDSPLLSSSGSNPAQQEDFDGGDSNRGNDSASTCDAGSSNPAANSTAMPVVNNVAELDVAPATSAADQTVSSDPSCDVLFEQAAARPSVTVNRNEGSSNEASSVSSPLPTMHAAAGSETAMSSNPVSDTDETTPLQTVTSSTQEASIPRSNSPLYMDETDEEDKHSSLVVDGFENSNVQSSLAPEHPPTTPQSKRSDEDDPMTRDLLDLAYHHMTLDQAIYAFRYILSSKRPKANPEKLLSDIAHSHRSQTAEQIYQILMKLRELLGEEFSLETLRDCAADHMRNMALKETVEKYIVEKKNAKVP